MIGAFVTGSGNFVASLGIPSSIAIALMGVLVASFAGTTLDTSCRLQRYVIQELAAALGGRRDDERPGFAPMRLLTGKACRDPPCVFTGPRGRIAAGIGSVCRLGILDRRHGWVDSLATLRRNEPTAGGPGPDGHLLPSLAAQEAPVFAAIPAWIHAAGARVGDAR